MLQAQAAHFFDDRRKLRKEMKAFEGLRRELVQAVDAATELKAKQENQIAKAGAGQPGEGGTYQ